MSEVYRSDDSVCREGEINVLLAVFPYFIAFLETFRNERERKTKYFNLFSNLLYRRNSKIHYWLPASRAAADCYYAMPVNAIIPNVNDDLLRNSFRRIPQNISDSGGERLNGI